MWGIDLADREFMMPISEYIDNYLIRDDYKYSNYNVSTQTGLTLNTIHDHYPQAKFVEYYSPANEEEYRGWQMLRFVYEKIDDNWSLIGIVRDYPEH